MKKYLLAIVLVAAAWLLLGWLKPTDYRTVEELYTVKAGQTVWEIATIFIKKQDKRITVGEMVHKIKKANGLDPRRYIQPGDVLVIPLEQEAQHDK